MASQRQIGIMLVVWDPPQAGGLFIPVSLDAYPCSLLAFCLARQFHRSYNRVARRAVSNRKIYRSTPSYIRESRVRDKVERLFSGEHPTFWIVNTGTPCLYTVHNFPTPSKLSSDGQVTGSGSAGGQEGTPVKKYLTDQ